MSDTDKDTASKRAAEATEVESVPDNRSPSGQFLKGHSGNPGGRPKLEGDIRELAREHAPAAIKRLAQLMYSRNERVAVAACGVILDRAYGRASQGVRLDAEIRGPGLLEALTAFAPYEPPTDLADQRQAQVDDC